MVLNIILRDNINIRLSLDKMSEIKRERGFFHDKLYLPLTKLRNSPAFSLSPLKLLVCDGGIGRGVRFSHAYTWMLYRKQMELGLNITEFIPLPNYKLRKDVAC